MVVTSALLFERPCQADRRATKVVSLCQRAQFVGAGLVPLGDLHRSIRPQRYHRADRGEIVARGLKRARLPLRQLVEVLEVGVDASELF
jgi:hypothetical protein